MKRQLILFVLIFSVIGGFFLTPAPEAHAIDPVTIAILTPIAIKAAQIAAPYVLRGLSNMGVAVLKTIPDIVGILKLPVGLLMMTIGAPFGGFGKGVAFTIQGLIAPFKLCYHVVLIPLSLFRIGLN